MIEYYANHYEVVVTCDGVDCSKTLEEISGGKIDQELSYRLGEKHDWNMLIDLHLCPDCETRWRENMTGEPLRFDEPGKIHCYGMKENEQT